MDWKKKTIEELRLYETRKVSRKLIEERIAVIEKNMAQTKDGREEGTQTEERDALRSTLREINMQLSTMANALKVLEDRQLTVLDRFYINPVPNHVETLCEELAIEPSTVYRARGKALACLTMALFGVKV